MTTILETHTVGFEAARWAAEASLSAARELGISVCVAVVDRAGHLITYDRMDGAPLLCGQLAQDKAHTVAVFGLATHDWWSAIGNDPSLVHGLVKTERLVVFGGGVPIRVDDEFVGAVGVSGGSVEQDRAVAEAGAIAVSPGPNQGG